MKKDVLFVIMFFVLVAFVVLFVSSCGSARLQPSPDTNKTYTVTVDYSQSLDKMIDSACDWWSVYISTETFPVQGKGKATVKLHLVPFHRSQAHILAEMKKRNLRPATLPELLAFGAQYSGEIKGYQPIAALGTVWPIKNHGDNVSFLFRNETGIHLLVHWAGVGWNYYSYFLAAEK